MYVTCPQYTVYIAKHRAISRYAISCEAKASAPSVAARYHLPDLLFLITTKWRYLCSCLQPSSTLSLFTPSCYFPYVLMYSWVFFFLSLFASSCCLPFVLVCSWVLLTLISLWDGGLRPTLRNLIRCWRLQSEMLCLPPWLPSVSPPDTSTELLYLSLHVCMWCWMLCLCVFSGNSAPEGTHTKLLATAKVLQDISTKMVSGDGWIEYTTVCIV